MFTEDDDDAQVTENNTAGASHDAVNYSQAANNSSVCVSYLEAVTLLAACRERQEPAALVKHA
jgi:hypothetical protein